MVPRIIKVKRKLIQTGHNDFTVACRKELKKPSKGSQRFYRISNFAIIFVKGPTTCQNFNVCLDHLVNGVHLQLSVKIAVSKGGTKGHIISMLLLLAGLADYYKSTLL